MTSTEAVTRMELFDIMLTVIECSNWFVQDGRWILGLRLEMSLNDIEKAPYVHKERNVMLGV